MNHFLIFILVLVALVVLTNILSRDKKNPAGSCQKCPEYRYCGGGRPRCPRRGERKNQS